MSKNNGLNNIFELTPDNLKELKQIKPLTDEEQINNYKEDLNKIVDNINNLNDVNIILKIKLPNIKNYKYDYDKIVSDLANKGILITKKELKKILDIINK
jgi:DNA-directed RNA polymerase subunit F